MNIFDFPVAFGSFSSALSWMFHCSVQFIAVSFMLNFILSTLKKVIRCLTHNGGMIW